MNKERITVKLTPTAQTILGTDWVELDLKPGFSFRLSKQVEELTAGNNFVVESALPFSVPFSTVNDLALLPFSSAVILDNNTVFIETRASSGSLQLPFDRIYFRSRNDTSREYELEFRTSSEHWAFLASTKKLNTINLGTVTFDEALVYATWPNARWQPGADPFYFPVCDYGSWVDLNEPAQFTDAPVKTVNVEDMRFFFSLPAILKQGFCEIGWTLQGSILETEYVQRLWIYILKREFYVESRGGIHKLILRGTANFTFSSLVPLLKLNDIYHDPGSHTIGLTGVYGGLYENKLRYKTSFRVSLKGNMTNSGSAYQWGFRLIEVDVQGGVIVNILWNLLTPEIVVALGPGETRFVDVTFELDLNPGQAFGFFGTDGATWKKGYLFEVTPIQQTLMRGDTVELRKLIHPDYTLLDLFKGFSHLINGRPYTDWHSRVVTIYPNKIANVYGETVAGFLFEEAPPIDISTRTVCDSAKMSPIRNSQKRYSRLAFAETTDALIEEQAPLEPIYSRKILNGSDLPDGVTDIVNPFFQPTINRQNEELKRNNRPVPFFPCLLDNLDSEMSFDIGPRILFGLGYSVGQLNPAPTSILDKYLGIQFEQYDTNSYGYAAQLISAEMVNPVMDGSIVFGVQPFDLFVTFWLGLGQTNKRGIIYDILIFMGQKEYGAWDFRTKFLFVHDGRQIIAYGKSIRDFSTGDEIPTPMQLLVEPSDSACCDLPCSCRFEECTFYQDIGQYIQQATLDSLQITSFTVDQKEQIVVPVSLGLINLVQIEGRAYVTNLVDRLNELGVPYFIFSYSNKVFDPKDDLRYFKIKRPVCQAFEIVIEDTGGAVYKYTQNSQQQQWFAGTWSPMGYGGTTTDVPEDCVITIDY